MPHTEPGEDGQCSSQVGWSGTPVMMLREIAAEGYASGEQLTVSTLDSMNMYQGLRPVTV